MCCRRAGGLARRPPCAVQVDRHTRRVIGPRWLCGGAHSGGERQAVGGKDARPADTTTCTRIASAIEMSIYGARPFVRRREPLSADTELAEGHSIGLTADLSDRKSRASESVSYATAGETHDHRLAGTFTLDGAWRTASEAVRTPTSSAPSQSDISPKKSACQAAASVRARERVSLRAALGQARPPLSRPG